MHGVRYFVWLGLALLASAVINRFREKKLNPGSVALVTLGLFYLLDMVGGVVGLANAPGHVSPYQQGAFLGGITGAAIIPLGIALVIRNGVEKRAGAEEERSAASEVPREAHDGD